MRIWWKVRSVVLWMVVAVIAIDILLGWIFPPPRAPDEQLSTMRRYFDYGRSVEGKLRVMMGDSDASGTEVAREGWLWNECAARPASPPGKVGVSIYGMSFSQWVSLSLAKTSPELQVESFFAPAAPLSHSHACFTRQMAAGNQDEIQVMAVLASSLRRMHTLTGLTTSFEQPHPYTYPRYEFAQDGKLSPREPTVGTSDELRKLLASPADWERYMGELERNDDFFDRWQMRSDPLDHSVLGRLVRRAWGQSVTRARTSRLQHADGYDPDYIGRVAPALIDDFIERCRSAGLMPAIILFEDQGYDGVLDGLFEPLIARKDVVVVRSREVARATDASKFVGDGHFTVSVFDEITLLLKNRLAEALAHKAL
jgi:hypothetical protein